MKYAKAWRLTAVLMAALLVGCEQQTQEPVVHAPPQAPPPPMFPEEQVPRPEPQPVAGVPQYQPQHQPQYQPPPPVDTSVYMPPHQEVAAAPAPTPMPRESYARAPQRPSQTYTVQRGDTLQKISQKFYGTTTNWRKIYEANRGTLSHPDKLSVGQRLAIP
jgi:nucleoid-associated protein YgaU